MPQYSLSDPYSDFYTKEDVLLLRTIESKKGIDLNIDELLSIFQTYCSAGTTRELCCYVPYIFDYLSENSSEILNDDVMSIFDIFLEWIFHHKEELKTLRKYEYYTSKIWSYIQDVLSKKCNIFQNISNISVAKELFHTYFSSRLIDDTKRRILLEYITIAPEQFNILILHVYCESRSKNEPLYPYKKLIGYYLTPAYMRNIIELCLEQSLTFDTENEWMLKMLEDAETWMLLD
ncbi:MAG: hypothetical protein SNG49_09200 [Rikenellaceae bacterium]